MDWNNVDLNSHERHSNILDPYSFDTLLLEVSCNLRHISGSTVREQFYASLASHVQSAKEIFESNVDNIVKQALKERNSK